MSKLDSIVPSTLLLVVLFLFGGFGPWTIQPVEAALTTPYWEGTYYCKCICFGTNYTILPIYRPNIPEKPCLTCTKQWCLDQKLPICIGADVGGTDPDTGTGKEGDIEGRCFQREFPRDQVVVTLFLVTVCGLLLGAVIKTRMERGGMTLTTRPTWWENFLPSRPQPQSPLFDLRRSGQTPRSPSPSGYVPVSADDRA